MEEERVRKEAEEQERLKKEADALALAMKAQKEAEELAVKKKIQGEAAQQAAAAERLRQAQEDAISKLVAAEVESARLEEEKHDRLRQETMAEHARLEQERIAQDHAAMEHVAILTAQLEHTEHAHIQQTLIEEEQADQESIDRKLALIRVDSARNDRRDAVDKLHLPEVISLASPVASVSPALHQTRSMPLETEITVTDERDMIHLNDSAVVNHEESYDASHYYDNSTIALDDTKILTYTKNPSIHPEEDDNTPMEVN